MDPPPGATYAIFAHDNHTSFAEDETQTYMDDMTLAQPTRGEPARKRRRYNSRRTPAEWDMIKADMKKLYVDEDRSLEDTMTLLQANHGFEASRDQFKSKIKLWGFDKKVKTQEMKHIIRIDKRRLPKRTSFTVRKQPVSRNKIERYQKEHPLFLEPPSRTPSVISYKTSYSRGTPSLSPTTSPRLMPFEWYRSYGKYSNQAPEYSPHPLFKMLQKLRIQENTWEQWKFSEAQHTMFKDVYLEVRGKEYQGFDISSFVEIYNCADKPSRRWWASEIARVFQSRVDTIDISDIVVALEWSVLKENVVAAGVFCEVLLEVCRARRAKEPTSWQQKNDALHLVDHLIFLARFQAGEALLSTIMKDDFHKVAVPLRNTDWEPKWDVTSLQSMYWSRGITQLIVIRWFLLRPELIRSMFERTEGGLRIYDLHSCPRKNDWECECFHCFRDGLSLFSEANSYGKGDKTARLLIGDLDREDSARGRMLDVMIVSRFLPRLGHRLYSDEQGEAEVEDEEYPLQQKQVELDEWIMEAQRLSSPVHDEVSSTFEGCATSSRPGGYILEMEHFGLD